MMHKEDGEDEKKAYHWRARGARRLLCRVDNPSFQLKSLQSGQLQRRRNQLSTIESLAKSKLFLEIGTEKKSQETGPVSETKDRIGQLILCCRRGFAVRPDSGSPVNAPQGDAVGCLHVMHLA